MYFDYIGCGNILCTANAFTGLNHQYICTWLIENCKDFVIPRKQTEN